MLEARSVDRFVLSQYPSHISVPYTLYGTYIKMGPSRRMQKQGMPEPLNEALVTRKRKDAPAAPAPASTGTKKRRTDKKAKPIKQSGPNNSAGRKTTKGKFVPNGSGPKSKGKAVQQSVDSDADEDLEDESSTLR